MTTALATKAFKPVGALTGISGLDPKKLTTIIQIIEFSSDKKSVESTKGLVGFLLNCKKTLLVKDSEFKFEVVQKNLNGINKNLIDVDQSLNFIDGVFDENGLFPQEIIIDDPSVISVIKNLEESKKIMQYISDYLTLTLQIQKVKSDLKAGKGKTYTLDELLCECKAT